MDEWPAVKALGPLFKLTEVQLWDDGLSESESLYLQESTKIPNGDDDCEKGVYAGKNGVCSLTEDLELTQQMNDLGLPLSFRTNKETRYGMTSGKKRGTRKSKQQCLIEIDDIMLDSIKESEDESRSPDSLLDTSKMLGEYDALKNGILADIGGLSNLSIERVDSLSSTACTSTLWNEHEYNDEAYVDDDIGCSSGCGYMWDEAESIPCTNETMATGLGLDSGTSEGSCLINEGVDCDGKELYREFDPVHLDTVSVMGHETDGQSNDISWDKHSDEQANSNMTNNYQIANSGDWIAYWDDFHMRTYFCNVQTEESTWDPPSGMEHFVYASTTDEPTKIVAGLSEVENDQMNLRTSEEAQASCDPLSPHGLTNELRNDSWPPSEQWDGISEDCPLTENVFSTKQTNKKKKARKAISNTKISISTEDLQGVLHGVPPSISKYWCQRYILFSRFDNGIKMDEEGWFSVTPELLAKHHAIRCGHGAIVDLFTGVGGNAIQFAQWSKHVIAIDIDPIKIDYARHNAAIYGVDDRIDFIKGDSFSLAPKLKADTVFMSPPWGGPAYSKVKKFDINTMLKPRDGQSLFNAGKRIASRIVMFLPRNVDINQLAELSLSATPPWSLEVERNFLNGRLKAVTAYYSEPSMS